MRHTITARYVCADETELPVEITFQYYPVSNSVRFIWAHPQSHTPVSAGTRVEIEKWAIHWLAEHASEAVHLAEET